MRLSSHSSHLLYTQILRNLRTLEFGISHGGTIHLPSMFPLDQTVERPLRRSGKPLHATHVPLKCPTSHSHNIIPLEKPIYDQLAAHLFLFLWMQMVVLRSTSDIQVWERILLGMDLCDVAASLGVVQHPSGKSILQPYRLEMGRMGICCGTLWIWVNKIGLLCWNWAWPWRKVG